MAVSKFSGSSNDVKELHPENIPDISFVVAVEVTPKVSGNINDVRDLQDPNISDMSVTLEVLKFSGSSNDVNALHP